LSDHPGGAKALLVNCGKDSTAKFEEKGHGELHLNTMKQYMVGVWPDGKPNPYETKDKQTAFNANDISSHNNEKDCWIAVYNKVYDLTDYLYTHPGGHKVLLNVAGKDGTDAFEGKKHGLKHLNTMKMFSIGTFIGGRPNPFEETKDEGDKKEWVEP
jgi:cytochrome b involved in lipid metabolism